MNLQEHYETLYTESITKIKSGGLQTDSLIDSDQDKRYGLTLRIRPDTILTTSIYNFLDQLLQIEPDQYYYPKSDIHVTVMSIISCYNDFNLQCISIPDYINLIEQSIQATKNIVIRFTGITASPSCIMIKGFPEDETLHTIRNSLRTNFKNSSLEQSIDKRYSIQTAHATIVRFKKPLTRMNEYLKMLDIYRDHDFGTLNTNILELVHNDWYHRTKQVKQLYTFKL
jgi:2'-5' RNA ligase